jgi:hypothetical protein
MGTALSDLLTRLDAIEKQSADSTLVIYEPMGEQAAFYHALCDAYLKSLQSDRMSIRDAVSGKPGVINSLLGYLYVCVQKLRETRNADWFQIGLAAASIRGNGPDFRDFYLAMAELYAAALDAGLDPKNAFNAMRGGIPADFDTYAVVKSKLAGGG